MSRTSSNNQILVPKKGKEIRIYVGLHVRHRENGFSFADAAASDDLSGQTVRRWVTSIAADNDSDGEDVRKKQNGPVWLLDDEAEHLMTIAERSSFARFCDPLADVLTHQIGGEHSSINVLKIGYLFINANASNIDFFLPFSTFSRL